MRMCHIATLSKFDRPVHHDYDRRRIIALGPRKCGEANPMKMPFLGLIAAVMVGTQAFGQGTPTISKIEVYRTGDVVSIDAEKEVTLKFWFQQLMLSALYRNVVQDTTLAEWQRGASSPTRIHCRYGATVSLAVPERPSLSFEEVLLPLPFDRYPDFILIRRGDRVQRLAKYDQWLLHKLVSKAEITFYENLSQVERTLF